MDYPRLVVDAGLLLLLACCAAWFAVYRKLERQQLRSGHYYRWHQILVAIIAALAIGVTLVIVLASDPGIPEEYLYPP